MVLKTTNLGKTRRYGFDLSAEQKLENFTFKESYSFVKTKILKEQWQKYWRKRNCWSS